MDEVDIYNRNLLYLAAKNGFYDICVFLLEKGFDIDNEIPFIKFFISFNKGALILLKILKDLL